MRSLGEHTGATRLAARRFVVTLEREDHHRVWTSVAVAGLLAAAAIRVIGMPRLPLHPPSHYLGVMDPACGGTRAMVAAVRGNWALSWRYNPASVVLLAGAVASVTRHLVGRAVGGWLTVRVPGRTVMAGVVIALAWFELNQQAHAGFLR